MGKYQQVTCVEEDWHGVGRKDLDGVVRLVSLGDVVRLLNSPPPAPPGGIVWRRPGEAGRVDGKMYLVVKRGNVWIFSYVKGRTYDGWGDPEITAWAELPQPPAWEGESK